jgi:hypothetical protein
MEVEIADILKNPVAKRSVTGHDFSRADRATTQNPGFTGCGKTQLDRRFEGA